MLQAVRLHLFCLRQWTCIFDAFPLLVYLVVDMTCGMLLRALGLWSIRRFSAPHGSAAGLLHPRLTCLLSVQGPSQGSWPAGVSSMRVLVNHQMDDSDCLHSPLP